MTRIWKLAGKFFDFELVARSNGNFALIINHNEFSLNSAETESLMHSIIGYKASLHEAENAAAPSLPTIKPDTADATPSLPVVATLLDQAARASDAIEALRFAQAAHEAAMAFNLVDTPKQGD